MLQVTGYMSQGGCSLQLETCNLCQIFLPHDLRIVQRPLIQNVDQDFE